MTSHLHFTHHTAKSLPIQPITQGSPAVKVIPMSSHPLIDIPHIHKAMSQDRADLFPMEVPSINEIAPSIKEVTSTTLKDHRTGILLITIRAIDIMGIHPNVVRTHLKEWALLADVTRKTDILLSHTHMVKIIRKDITVIRQHYIIKEPLPDILEIHPRVGNRPTTPRVRVIAGTPMINLLMAHKGYVLTSPSTLTHLEEEAALMGRLAALMGRLAALGMEMKRTTIGIQVESNGTTSHNRPIIRGTTTG